MQRDKFVLPTTSLEQSPSSEVNISLASHGIPHILWNPQVHYWVHNSLPLICIPSQMNWPYQYASKL